MRLTGKASALLRYLVERAGQVVTKEELFAAVWPETVVSDAALTSCIQELRRALRDQAKRPRYIATVHRRGFQFIGPRQAPGLPEPLPVPVSQQAIERKLVAILSADVQGYSRLMSEDELATIRTLTAYREAMTSVITRHRGRVVDAPGDNLLAEFTSAVDAVQAAVAIQQDLKTRNAQLPPHRQMHYRIGINVGDVVVEGGRIYGDGVNIAARLEALAEGGGICLSRAVHEQVKNKVALPYEYVGERTVKNIAEPVQVYRVKVEAAAAAPKGDTATLQNASQVASHKSQVTSRKFSPAPSARHPTSTVVGRENELVQLHEWFTKALRGQRQVVFVTGEPGIGKTTVVETFLGQVAGAEELWIGRGQCVEHYGAGEAYLPVLEALGRLCREAEGKEVIALLRQQAPTWLVQMPSLVSTAELEELQRRTAGVTRERMLRELAEALEALTAERALILRLEDLHWSDYSTLDLLSVLARRHEAAQLLILGTYRPVEVLTREHPLKGVKHELQLHGRCEELALDFLSETAVAEYLAQRFGSPSPVAAGEGRGEGLSAALHGLAHVIHQRTDGNPLFMVNVTNELVRRGVIAQGEDRWVLPEKVEDLDLDVPKNLRQLIEQQIERVSPAERAILEAASVVGVEFSAAAVAAGAGKTVEEVEQCCDTLVRREQFLRMGGITEWPDGTVSARYTFLHTLYQEVVYRRLTPNQCRRLHRQIGEGVEVAYGKRAREVAAELGMHFEQGREYAKAVHYLRQAGENALRRSAHHEAIALLRRGLGLLPVLPDTPERSQQELRLQITLGTSLIAAKGSAAPEVGRAYARARELCRQLGETPQLFPALGGLFAFYQERAELKTASELAEQMFSLAHRVQEPMLLLWAHVALGSVLYSLGELLSARAHLEQSLTFYDPQKHRSYGFVSDPRVRCLSEVATLLWFLGYPDQALERSQEALALARELSHPFSLATALSAVAGVYRLRRDEQAAYELEEARNALASEHEFPALRTMGIFWRGWDLIGRGRTEEGIAQMQQGLTALQDSGAELARPGWLVLLAEAYGQVRQIEVGLSMLAEGLAAVDKNGWRVFEAELYRLKGQLTLQSKTSPRQVADKSKTGQGPSKVEKEAEECFLKAIEIARKQQAKSLELRAATSLARLWQQQGKKKEAHSMLAEIYGWFTEGFDTKDLQEAKALLEELDR